MRHSVLRGVKYEDYVGGRGLLERGIPWLSVGAIVALETYICRPDVLRKETPEMRDARYPHRVLELGSGGSTVFWARNTDHVTSFETDPAWAPKTLEWLGKHGLAERVDLRAVPHAQALVDVAALPDASYDLLLVDHADPTLRRGRIVNRLELAMVALSKLRTNGWLCIDNFRMHGCENFDYTDWHSWEFCDMRYSGKGTLIARRKSAFPLRVSL